MKMRRGHADWSEDMTGTCIVPQHATPDEEKSYLKDTIMLASSRKTDRSLSQSFKNNKIRLERKAAKN